MLSETISQVSIETQVVKEVVALEDPVVLYDPVVLLAHEGLENRRRKLGMIDTGQGVTDIVQQGAHDVFVISPVPLCAGRGLETMGEAVHRVATRISLENFQVLQHAIREVAEESLRVLGDRLVVVTGRIPHGGERRLLQPII